MVQRQVKYQQGDKLVRFVSEEWSALYINGQLDTVGDSYLVDERLEELLEVKHYDSDDYFLGNPVQSYATAAKTLAEIETYQKEKLDAKVKAETLREEAKRLLEEADKLAPKQ